MYVASDLLSSMSFSSLTRFSHLLLLFFFNDPAPTETYTLSLHDALPISSSRSSAVTTEPVSMPSCTIAKATSGWMPTIDRKSTRLNSSHTVISYAVFCLKKKKKIRQIIYQSKHKYITAV